MDESETQLPVVATPVERVTTKLPCKVVCVLVLSLLLAASLAFKNFRSSGITGETVRMRLRNQTKIRTKRVRPYFGNSNVHVLQMGGLNYANRMENHTKRNRQWIDCMSYEYRFEKRQERPKNKAEKGPCIFTQKVGAIHRALEEIPLNDWLIYLDLDVQYQAASCDALERILPRESREETQPCEIIMLSTKRTINTGVILLKATIATRYLIQRWYNVQQEEEICDVAADQITLQEVVMEEMLGDVGYQGECRNVSRQSDRNRCFEKHMGEDQRSIRQLCLPGCSASTPLQCHDCPKKRCNNSTAIFRHEKVALLDLPPPL